MAERQALGVDIDAWQEVGGTNYELFRQHIRDGVADFLIIQAGVGNQISPVFNEQRQNSEQLGIPYVTYHLIDPEDNIEEQAQKYVDWVGTGDPAYIFDVEKPRENSRPPNRQELLRYLEALTALIDKEPILYSTMNILKEINFLDQARQFRLWIAQYPDVIHPTPQNKVYKYFDQFLADFAHKLPKSVRGTPLADNVILWQFTKKGDGHHYISNRLTAAGNIGVREVDLDISIHERDTFMQEIFGTGPAANLP